MTERPKLPAGLPPPTWCDEEHGVALYHGDCREVLFCLNEFGSLITDPPYGIVNKFGTNSGNGMRVMEFSWDKPEAIREAIREAISKMRRSSSAFVFTGFDTVEIAREELRRAGYTVKPAAWLKECPPPAGYGNWWPSAFELAMYCYRKSPWFGDSDAKRTNVFMADSYRHGQPGSVNHPTQKPLVLMKRIVASLAAPGDSVLDPFCGSGTTLVAAKLLGRKATGIEIEEKYCEIAANRLRQGVLEFAD